MVVIHTTIGDTGAALLNKCVVLLETKGVALDQRQVPDSEKLQMRKLVVTAWPGVTVRCGGGGGPSPQRLQKLKKDESERTSVRVSRRPDVGRLDVRTLGCSRI